VAVEREWSGVEWVGVDWLEWLDWTDEGTLSETASGDSERR
jgi:hypothetical protein